METVISELLCNLYKNHFQENAVSFSPLPASGSSRKYFRISGDQNNVIGAFSPDKRENRAFLYLSQHFKLTGLPVPEIYVADNENDIYLLEDLGDTTLFEVLNRCRQEDELTDPVKSIYKKVIGDLPRFQVKGHEGLDYSYCYPRAAFDKQSMLWDLNYFKYYFLKLAGISFDEQNLENDFQDFADLLLSLPSDFFMYRDFQSRNIMVQDQQIYYIDYQGGRKGNPYYDLASLLYDAKANLPEEFRKELTEEYIINAERYYNIEPESFIRNLTLVTYIRLMQAMGAYGFRGFYEKKEIFLQSIPYALNNLQRLIEQHPLPGSLNSLSSVLVSLTESTFLRSLAKPRLEVVIRSFSYKRGIPTDTGGHGGGFVFDCRALPNPGRDPEFQNLTGRDPEVIHFLSREKEVEDYLFSVYNIVDQSVKNYLTRHFDRLSVNFGCTGGQHRSVYMAEKLKEHLVGKFGIKVVVEHSELGSF